jgi:hypothetical protein
MRACPACFAALLLAVGCETAAKEETGGGTETGEGDTSADTDTAAGDTADTGGLADCHGTPPVVEDLTVEEGDPREDDGTTIPTLKFTVAFTDVDGDVNEVQLKLWADTVVDGAADTSVKPVSDVGPVTMAKDGTPVPDCEGDLGSVVFSLGITGRGVAFDTTYEFAMVVVDAGGLSSDPKFVVTTTPAAIE